MLSLYSDHGEKDKVKVSPNADKKCLYIFLDESGDLQFRPSGSKYFVLGATSTFRPFSWSQEMEELQKELLEEPHNLELQEFHANRDRHLIKEKVFDALERHTGSFRFDSVVVQKNKAHPKVRVPLRFYPMILKCLLEHIVGGYDLSQISELIVVTDELQKNDRETIKKGIKLHLSDGIFNKLKYKIYHWDSKSEFGLQVTDYISWAVQRKWTADNLLFYEKIRPAVKSEFDIFRRGPITYY